MGGGGWGGGHWVLWGPVWAMLQACCFPSFLPLLHSSNSPRPRCQMSETLKRGARLNLWCWHPSHPSANQPRPGARCLIRRTFVACLFFSFIILLLYFRSLLNFLWHTIAFSVFFLTLFLISFLQCNSNCKKSPMWVSCSVTRLLLDGVFISLFLLPALCYLILFEPVRVRYAVQTHSLTCLWQRKAVKSWHKCFFSALWKFHLGMMPHLYSVR